MRLTSEQFAAWKRDGTLVAPGIFPFEQAVPARLVETAWRAIVIAFLDLRETKIR